MNIEIGNVRIKVPVPDGFAWFLLAMIALNALAAILRFLG